MWLFTALALIYFGYDVHKRLALASKETTISKSMLTVGTIFFLLAVYHIHEDMLGADPPLAIHVVPVFVLGYAVYEYRKLLREAGAFDG